MKSFLILLNCLIINVLVFGQSAPAPAQSSSILIINAKIHTGNGKVIDKGAIGFDKGKIIFIGEFADKSKFNTVIDADNKYIYPGLIAPNTRLGLVEIDAIRPTRDFAETGEFNPSVRSLIAYNTDSKVLPTIRSNGVLMVQIAPSGGRISGQSSIVELDAWNWEDAAYRVDDGIHIQFPDLVSQQFGELGRRVAKNEQYSKQIAELDAFLAEAQAYRNRADATSKNLKFEAMKGLFDKSKTVYLHADKAREITEGVILMQKYGFKTVLVEGSEAYMVTELLKKYEIPVILTETQALPDREDDDIDQKFKNATLLQKAGILFCFSMSGNYQQRNLPFQAGQAVGFGLDKNAALSGLTYNAAKILGIDATVGSLEVGKDATLLISEGDIMDMRTSVVVRAFIRGREIDLDDKQKELYRKFKTKYESQK
jgi:imidazolonepropionase-like amidohydrolase